jgi:adenylate cyclase
MLCLEDTLNDIVQATSSLIRDPSELNMANQTFIYFGFALLKADNNIYSVYAANEKGDFLWIFQLAILERSTYYSNPDKPLPQGSTYVVQTTHQTPNGPINLLRYYDEKFHFLAEETTSENYDPRVRPWYVNAKQVRHIYWTDPYLYLYGNQKAISILNPIIVNDSFIGVAGIDLSFNTLSHFLTSLKVGKTGIACIVDKDGNLIEPQGTPFKSLIQYAFAEFSKAKVDKLIIKYEGTKYLVGFDLLPESFEKEWYVAVIIPMSDFFTELFNAEKKIIIVSIILLIISSVLIYYFAKKISSPIVEISKEITEITHLDFSHEKRISSNIIEIKILDAATALLSSAMRSFAKYLPKEVVRLLLSRGKEIELSGEKKEITVLFTDIQGFTTIAEALDTEELMVLLEEYFDLLSKIILTHQGTIDKYIGDSIMAFWGMPIENKDHALLTCKAALACCRAVEQLNAKRREKGMPEFITRIGISAGTAIVGNIGTEQRMNYTVIGDIVNTAARLQTVNKIYHTSIIINEALHDKIKELFLTRPLDNVEVKGKTTKLTIFELIAENGQGDAAFCQRFQEAYEAYQGQDRERARTLFEEIHRDFPDDYPTMIYLERLRH